MNRFGGAEDRTKETKASPPRKHFASLFHSRRGNERQSGSENQTEDTKTADATISLPRPWAIDRNTFTRTAAPGFNDSNGDTEYPVADIIRSLDEFIASVTIPPPPPLLLLPPPPLRNCLPARRDVVSGQNNFPQQDFGLNTGRYDRNRNKPAQSFARARQQDWTVFGDSRSDSNQSINLLPPQQQLSENFSSPSEVDFSKLVIPPPPPSQTPSPKSILKKRESRTFCNDRENCRFNSAMVTAAAQRPKLPPLPPPLPPPMTPPPLVRQLPSLPPLHPNRSWIAGRSPSLGSRASSAGGSLGRAAPKFLRVPPSERPPLGFSEDPVSTAEPRGSEDDDVYGDSKQTDGIFDDRRKNGERDSSTAKRQITRRNNDECSTDDAAAAAAAAALRRRIVVEPPREETLSRTYNSVGTFSRAAPPVLAPRLNSSVNSSPVAKRPVRRVSFDRCPPSTLCPPPSDKERDDRQNQTDEGQTPATAQIRPSALRSSSSIGFHGVVVRGGGGDGKAPPGGKDAVTSADVGGRTARSGSVDSAPSRTGASVFATIRSKLKSYWSPSAPNRKTPLPVNNSVTSADKKISVELGRVEGSPQGRKNWFRGRNSSKERSNANVDSRLIVNRLSADGEDESLEFYRELKQTIPKTFQTFNGRRI